jgi:hypothetical protein
MNEEDFDNEILFETRKMFCNTRNIAEKRLKEFQSNKQNGQIEKKKKKPQALLT